MSRVLPSYPPEAYTIVGLDTDDGEEHPLWDPSCNDEPDEVLAESLGTRGQLQAIVIRKNGDRLEVVAGRSRVKAARLWNTANPDRKIELRNTVRRGDSPVELVELVIAENEHRKPKPIVVRARMAQKLLNLGRTMEQVAKLYHVHVTTLYAWLETLDTAPEIQAAMEHDGLSKAEVDEIANLTHKDQAAVLELAKEGGTTLAEAAEAAGVKLPPKRRRPMPRSETKTRIPGRDDMRAAIEEDIADDEITWRDALRWVLGERDYLIKRDQQT